MAGVTRGLDDILMLEVHSIKIIEDVQRLRTAIQRRSTRKWIPKERIIKNQIENKGKRRKGEEPQRTKPIIFIGSQQTLATHWIVELGKI